MLHVGTQINLIPYRIEFHVRSSSKYLRKNPTFRKLCNSLYNRCFCDPLFNLSLCLASRNKYLYHHIVHTFYLTMHILHSTQSSCLCGVHCAEGSLWRLCPSKLHVFVVLYNDDSLCERETERRCRPIIGPVGRASTESWLGQWGKFHLCLVGPQWQW